MSWLWPTVYANYNAEPGNTVIRIKYRHHKLTLNRPLDNKNSCGTDFLWHCALNGRQGYGASPLEAVSDASDDHPTST